MKRSEKKKLDEELRSCAKKIILEFDTKYPTEAHYAQKVAEHSDDDFSNCRACGSENVCRSEDGRSLYCRCGNTSWLTAQTFFHKVSDLRRYLIAIELREQNVVVSAKMFAELVDIPYASAWTVTHKLDIVTARTMGDSEVMVASSNLVSLYARRSRETPARTHPIAEQQEIDEEANGEFAESDVDDARDNCSAASEHAENGTQNEFECFKCELLEMLSTVEPVAADMLCAKTGRDIGQVYSALVMLMCEGKVVDKPGDVYLRLKGKASSKSEQPSESSLDAIEAFITFVKQRFQGIARKYVQLYAASFWCFTKRWQANFLLRLCARSNTISRQDILNYVSPRDILLPVAV